MTDQSSTAQLSVPFAERIAEALDAAGFDESDVANAVEALQPLVAQHERVWHGWNDALNAISDAVLLIKAFDPTYGAAQTRKFLGDLDRLLRGKP